MFFSGYLYTPSGANQFTSDGMSYGCLTVSYYIDGSTDPVVENNAESEHFTVESPANTWVYFCVTSTVPLPRSRQRRHRMVSCVIKSANADEDASLGGVLCFDSLSLVYLAREYPADYSKWLMDSFGTTNGARIGMEQDYDSDGSDNWSEFIAGTDPANAQAMPALTPDATAGGTGRSFLAERSGRFYRLSGTANTSLTGFSVLANSIAATPPMNVYTAMPPASPFYYRMEISTNTFQ
jgi:hypothetical protein